MCKPTQTPSFPDQTETGPGSENIFKNIFESGQIEEFNFGLVQVRVFFTRVRDISFWGFWG